MKNREVKLFLYGISITYMIGIFLLSSQPSPPQPAPPTVPFRSTIEHTIEYAFLSFLLSLSFNFPKKEEKSKNILAILFATLYGFTDEFHQFFVPGRYCTIIDILADSFGSLMGGFIFIFTYHRFYQQTKGNSKSNIN